MSDVTTEKKLTDKKNTAPSRVQELMEQTGRSKAIIYRLAKRLGRLPTVEEVINRPNGRPKKYE